MRVIIVPQRRRACQFSHPKLFAPRLCRSRAADAGGQGSPEHMRILKSIAASKASDAEAAGRKATEARRVATRKSADAASAAKALQAAEAARPAPTRS